MKRLSILFWKIHAKTWGEQKNRTIGNYIHGKNGDCKIYPSSFAVFLNADNKNYVEPDISVICDKSKLDFSEIDMIQ